MTLTNHQFRLAARPVGLPKSTDWSATEEPAPVPGDGEVLVKVLYLSLDPAMRGWMNEGKSYIAPVGIGEVMRAGGVGTVVLSKHPGFTKGDAVQGGFGLDIDLSVEIAGLSEADAHALVETAHKVCPYSNATRNNVDVRLHVTVV